MALLGGDPTVGPAGIRVSVGREIRREVQIVGGNYVGSGWLERPSMVLDLLDPATALEYLAGNLRRGQERLAWSQRGDWAASARWHNTGVVYDSAIVRPADWDKGTGTSPASRSTFRRLPLWCRTNWSRTWTLPPGRLGGRGRDGQASRWPPASVAQ